MAERAYHHGDLRAALLAETRQMLREDGLAEFSVAKVAKRLGVSSASPYRHFSNREALLAEVAIGVARELAELVEVAAATSAPAAERLADAVGGYAGYLVENRVGLELILQFGPAVADAALLHRQSRRFWDGFFGLAADTVSGGPADVLVLLDQTIAIAHGYAAIYHQRVYAEAARSPENIRFKAARAVHRLLS